MRFQLIDRIESVEPGTSLRAIKQLDISGRVSGRPLSVISGHARSASVAGAWLKLELGCFELLTISSTVFGRYERFAASSSERSLRRGTA